ncbi:MAG TPA: ribosome maturation factor RimM [Thermoanaerobaculia bacterium]|jgi:16S rRNA processing protein RimM|nr:ribosome maturation factor RimM [Thermoanaerobaculia bacterium]
MGERIAVGIIRKPHGVRGEASVEPWTESPERFRELRAVTLVSPDEANTRTIEIERARSHSDRALVKFRGIDSPEQIRALQNWTIEIPSSEARKLDPNEYFLHDLVGLTLVDSVGKQRGVVKEVYEGGGGVLLNVDGPRGEFEVPFAAEICTEIDLKEKRIIVELPEGIDDLGHVED